MRRFIYGAIACVLSYAVGLSLFDAPRHYGFNIPDASIISPAYAQACNPPSGWLLQNGQISVGHFLAYGPGCGELTDGGAAGGVPWSTSNGFALNSSIGIGATALQNCSMAFGCTRDVVIGECNAGQDMVTTSQTVLIGCGAGAGIVQPCPGTSGPCTQANIVAIGDSACNGNGATSTLGSSICVGRGNSFNTTQGSFISSVGHGANFWGDNNINVESFGDNACGTPINGTGAIPAMDARLNPYPNAGRLIWGCNGDTDDSFVGDGAGKCSAGPFIQSVAFGAWSCIPRNNSWIAGNGIQAFETAGRTYTGENPNTVNSNSGINPLNCGNLLAGIIQRTGSTPATFTDTTPTAAQIVACSAFGIGNGAEVKLSIPFSYQNQTTGIATLGAGANVTLAGNMTIYPGQTAKFLLTVVANALASEAVTITRNDIPIYYEPGSVSNCIMAIAAASNNLVAQLTTQAGNTPSPLTPCYISFRNTTAATGDYTPVPVVAATSITIDAGSTLGITNTSATCSAASSCPFRIWVVAINNGGTPVLGLVALTNASGTLPLNENVVQSTIACAGCVNATTLGTIYSTAAQTSKAIRIIGFAEWGTGLATAGTYTSGPTISQMMGPGVKKPGDIVQTLMASVSSANTSTSNTFGTGAAPANAATVSITPTSAANPILVMFTGQMKDASLTNANTYCQIFRGASGSVNTGVGPISGMAGSGAAFTFPGALMALDTPGVTSTIQYTERIKNSDNTTSVSCPGADLGGPSGVIIAQEIMG
jgi:hypothetical protein